MYWKWLLPLLLLCPLSSFEELIWIGVNGTNREKEIMTCVTLLINTTKGNAGDTALHVQSVSIKTQLMLQQQATVQKSCIIYRQMPIWSTNTIIILFPTFSTLGNLAHYSFFSCFFLYSVHPRVLLTILYSIKMW